MHDLTQHCDFVCNSADRQPWLVARRTGIGASESPGILGVSPWSSGIAVFAEKVDPDPPVETNQERLELGLAMEPVILDRYRAVTGRIAEGSNTLLRSKRWPFMLTTLDGKTVINGDPAVLELKNTQDREGWSNGVPRHVWVQVQHQMAVTGTSRAAVAVLLMGCEFKTADVLRDDEFIEEALVPACEHFWGLVQKGGPPPQVDGSDASRAALKRLYINDTGDNIVLADEVWTKRADRREELKQRIKADGLELQEVENFIKAEIGEGKATFATLSNGAEFSWKANKHGARTLRYRGPIQV
jgi:putative phage-type endonuclease